jgi:hypothetical protein
MHVPNEANIGPGESVATSARPCASPARPIPPPFTRSLPRLGEPPLCGARVRVAGCRAVQATARRLRPGSWVKRGQVPSRARGAADISPVRVRNSARKWVPGVIVGQPRRIAPFLTHDHRWIPYGGISGGPPAEIERAGGRRSARFCVSLAARCVHDTGFPRDCGSGGGGGSTTRLRGSPFEPRRARGRNRPPPLPPSVRSG